MEAGAALQGQGGKVDPKRGKFCKRCPHKSKSGDTLDCFANPRKTFPADNYALKRIAAQDTHNLPVD